MILGRCGWNRVPKVTGRYTSSDIKPSRTVALGDCALTMISGRSPSSLSIPRPDKTSLRP